MIRLKKDLLHLETQGIVFSTPKIALHDYIMIFIYSAHPPFCWGVEPLTKKIGGVFERS